MHTRRISAGGNHHLAHVVAGVFIVGTRVAESDNQAGCIHTTAFVVGTCGHLMKRGRGLLLGSFGSRSCSWLRSSLDLRLRADQNDNVISEAESKTLSQLDFADMD